MAVLPITVAISTYNRAHYLKLCLDSVFASVEQPAEVLVMNDGSPDNTAEVVAAYGESVTYHSQENQGAAAARNVLIKLATQKYIMFLDDDDLLMPEALSLLYKAITTGQGKPAGAYGQYLRIDGDGNDLPAKMKKKTFPSGMIISDIFRKNLVLPSATLVDREYIAEQQIVFPTHLRVIEDYSFFLELTRRIPFYAVNTPIVKRRRHKNNLSASDPNGAIIEFNVLKDFYEKYPDVREAVPWPLARKRLAEMKVRAARNQKDRAKRRQYFSEALALDFSFKALWGKLFS